MTAIPEAEGCREKEGFETRPHSWVKLQTYNATAWVRTDEIVEVRKRDGFSVADSLHIRLIGETGYREVWGADQIVWMLGVLGLKL